MDGLREDQAQIGEVLIRYASGIDQRDWDLFRTCWTADVVADYGAIGRFSGIDALTDFMFASHDAMGPTHHRLVQLRHRRRRGRRSGSRRRQVLVLAVLIATPGDLASWIDALGHYDDTFVRTGDGWRISHRIVHMARVMTADGAH
jgi:hypothetical protein